MIHPGWRRSVVERKTATDRGGGGGGGAARIVVPREAVDMEMRSSSMLSVVESQSVPSRISVVLVEEAEVWGAECLASVPVDKALPLLARAACPASVTVCEDCIMMPGVVGTLSPSISDSVGHVGTLSPSDSDSVGLCGMLSPSDSDSVGPVGPEGTLSSSDLAGILFPAVPAGIPFPIGLTLTMSSSAFDGMLIPAVPAGLPFPAGPIGTLSPSDFESADPVGPVGALPPCDIVTGLFPIVPVGELSSVDTVRRPPGGLVPVVWT